MLPRASCFDTGTVCVNRCSSWPANDIMVVPCTKGRNRVCLTLMQSPEANRTMQSFLEISGRVWRWRLPVFCSSSCRWSRGKRIFQWDMGHRNYSRGRRLCCCKVKLQRHRCLALACKGGWIVSRWYTMKILCEKLCWWSLWPLTLLIDLLKQ